MKNIYTLLENAGVSIPEDKKSAFDTAFAENYKTVAEHKKVKDARDDYKARLDTATETLKGFEGVDINELKNKVATLTQDLATAKTDFDKQMDERDFNDLVGSVAQEFKAKDLKAVLPFLDVEALKGSKNRNEDIKSAFEQVKKDKAYLFEDEGAPKVVSYTTGPDKNTNDTNTKANEALRSLFGKD